MSTGRTPKRARQKERREAVREAYREAARRRRRQRWIVLSASLALIGGGVLIVLFVQGGAKGTKAKTKTSSETSLAAPTPQPVACGAELPAAAGSKKASYSAPRDQHLDPSKRYLLRLETSCGDIEIELAVKESPKTTNSVAFLARRGYYNGLVFHRIVPGFALQGGDPMGDGTGGPGYDVVEPPPKDLRYEKGIVAMAKGGNDAPGTSGSQFFIVPGDGAKDLPAEYAYLGKVVKGTSVMAKIDKLGSATPQGSPSAWVYIERANIVEE
jgi:cyclophilin family peptidyl-prolyl cis-trans isomerase